MTVGVDPSAARRLRKDWAESLAEHMDARRPKMTRKGLRHALAELNVEVTEQAIGCWLRGETSPRPEHQAALATIFSVPVRRLFPIEPAVAGVAS
jgi:hypothetical protein